jgi:hypothetical protein
VKKINKCVCIEGTYSSEAFIQTHDMHQKRVSKVGKKYLL